MLHSPGSTTPPSHADIHKIVAQLRDDLSQDVRTEVADRILQLVGAEPHPAVRAALLERAARLVVAHDSDRAVGLLRESFRQFPSLSAGRRLRVLAEDDPAFVRLNRMGHLVDAMAGLATGEERAEVALDAVRAHVQLGHGASAMDALQRLRDAEPEHPELAELSEIAEQQQQARAETLTALRIAIGEADDADRPQALMAYAELLLAGEEPLGDAAAVLADAVDAGAPLAEVGPLWVEVARAMGDPQELTRALAVSLGAGEALVQRLQFADELAGVPGIDRAEPAAALLALTVLTDALPDDLVLRARREVARAWLQGDAAEPALEELRMRALKERDRDGEAVVCLALAQVAQTQGDIDKAERHFRRVRTLAPQNAEALDFFENWYRTAGDHKRLLVALTQRLAIAEGRATVRIALEIAQLCEGPLAAPERAGEAWQRVLAVQPDHPQAMAALTRLYREQARWQPLRELLDRAARAETARVGLEPEAAHRAAALLAMIAELHQDPAVLPDADLALTAWRQVLALAPSQPRALAAVVADAQARGDHALALQVLEHAASVAVAPEEIADLAMRTAEAHERAGNPETAATWWQRAAAATPGSIDLATRLVAVRRTATGAEGQDDTALLTALLDLLTAICGTAPAGLQAEQMPSALAQAAADPLPALEEAAALAEALERQDEAVHLYRLLLAARPGHPAALAGLGRLCATPERGAILAAILATEAARPDQGAAQRAAILAQLAELQSAILHDAAAAERTADALLQLLPESPIGQSIRARALVQRGDVAALRALYPQTDTGDLDYAEAILAAAQLQTGAAQVELKVKAAAALALHSGHVERAAMVLADALQAALAQPATEARGVLVATTAEALLAHARSAKLVGLQREAAEALVAYAPPAESVRWRGLQIDLCEQAGLHADAATAAAELAEELLVGEKWADLQAVALRFATMAAAADEDLGIADRLASWAEIATDANSSDPENKSVIVWLWREAAGQALAHDDSALARRCLDAALALQANDTELLTLLQRACADQGDWSALVDTLERMAALAPAEQRADLLLRAATQCDLSLSDANRSQRLYRDVLTCRPASLEAHAGLLEALRQQPATAARATDLAAALDAFLAQPHAGREAVARAALERMELVLTAGDPQPLAPALPILARLIDYAELQEGEETLLAVATAQLDMAEAAPAAASALLPVLRQHNRDDDVLRCLEVLAAAAPDADDRVLRFIELADALERDQPERAWAALSAAWQSAPERADLLDRVTRVAARTGHDGEVNNLLLALAGEAELPGIIAVKDTAARARLLTLRADRAVRAGDAATAANLYTLVAALTPEDAAPLEALEALYREAGDLDAVAMVLEDRLKADADADPDERMSTWLRLAALYSEERAEPAEAESVLARAVSELPQSMELWTAWLNALRELGDRGRLATALQKRLECMAGDQDDPEARQAVRLEVAELLDLGDDRLQALQHWLAVLDIDPADGHATARATDAWLGLAQGGVPEVLVTTADRLETVLEARGDFIPLDAVLALRAQHATGPARKVVLLRQAFLRERGMTDPMLAFSSLAEALQVDPTDADVVAELQRLARVDAGAGQPEPTVVGAVLATSAITLIDLPARRARRALALSWLAGAGDDARSLRRDTYDAMLTDDPADAEALEGLDRLTLETGDDRARLTVLAARAKVAAKSDQLPLLMEHARLAMQLGEDLLAIKDLRGVLGTADVEARREAAGILCDLHERRGEQRELAEALMVLRGTMDEPDARLALSLRAASVLAQYGDGDRARTLLIGERSEHPRDPRIHDAITALLRATGDRPALADHLRHGWTDVFTAPSDVDNRLLAAMDWLASRRNPADLGALWPDVTAVLDAGLRGPDLDALLADMTTIADRKIALAAAQRRVDMAQAGADGAGEVAARLDMLDQFSEVVDERAQRIAVARLLEGPLGDPESALSQWQVLLATTAWSEQTAAEATRLADACSQGTEIDEEIRAAASRIADIAARNTVRMRLCERAYIRDEMGRLADQLDEVLADQPDHGEAYAMRGAVLTELPEWHHTERLAAHWRHGIRHASDPLDLRTARLQLSQLLHEHLGGSGEAFDLLRAQLAEAPAAADAGELRALALLYGEAAGRRSDVRALLLEQAELADPGMARAESLLAIAEQCLHQDNDPDAASAIAQQAWAQMGQGAPVPAALDLALDHAVAVAPELLQRVATALRDDQPARAFVLLQRALAADLPADARKALLRDLVAVAPAAKRAGADIDPIALARDLAMAEPDSAGHWAALAAACTEQPGILQESLLEAAQTSEDPALRHDLLVRAAAAADSAGDPETAAALLRLALEAEERAGTREALHRLLAATGRHDELALDLEALAATMPDQAADLLARAAGLWSGPAGDPTRALDLLRKLAVLRPNDPALADLQLMALQASGDARYGAEVTAAADLARTACDRDRLVALLTRQLDLLADAAQPLYEIVRELRELNAPEALTAKAVAALFDRLADLQRAAAGHVANWRISALDPAVDGDAWLHARLASMDLIDDDAARSTAWLEVSRHARDRMQDRQTALEWLLHALSPAPAATALRELAGLVPDADAARLVLAALTPLLGQNRTDRLAIAETGFDLGQQYLGDSQLPGDAEALAPFARQLATTDTPRMDAALWLEDFARATGDDEGLRALLQARATWLEGVDVSAAIDTWLQLADGPTNDATLQALDRVLSLQPDHEGALHLRLHAASAAGDHARVVALAEALGAAATADQRLAHGRALQALGNPAAALLACDAALATPGMDAGQRMAALQLRAGLLEANLHLVPPGERETATRELAATLAAELGQADRAIELLLELAAHAAEPLDVLVQAGDIARAADLLDMWVDGIGDLASAETLPAGAVGPALALAAAAVAEGGDAARAADLWQIAWDQDPDDADAREAVLALRRDAGDPNRLAADLERALMLGGGDTHALRLELAELKRTALGRPREALRMVLDILTADPQHAVALAMADTMMRTAATADEALAELEPLFRHTHQWQGLANVLELRLERPLAGPQRAELARELARIQAEQLGDRRQMLRALIMAVQASPSLDSLTALEREADAKTDAKAIADAYAQVLAAGLATTERAQVLRKAVIFEQSRGDAATAEQHLQALAILDPDDAEAFEQLEALLDAAGRWDDVIALWQARLTQNLDADQRRVGLHRLAGIARAVGRTPVALAALREQTRLDPADADPWQAIVEILRDEAPTPALADALVALARVSDTAHDTAELLCEAARLCLRALKDADRAADCYDEAFKADPTVDEAYVYLERQADHEARRLEPLYALRAAALAPGPTRTLTLRRLAHARAEREDGERACQALEQALVEDPANAAVLEDLLRLAEHHRVWPSFVLAAKHKLAHETRREPQVALHGHLARIALTDLPDAQAAQQHLHELQQLAPGEAVTRHLQALAQANSGDPHEAAAGLELMIREAEDTPTQISLHQRLADLYAGPLATPAKAIREYQKLLTLDPRRWQVRRKLCDLYAERNSPEAQAECLRQWIGALNEGDGRGTMRMELGGEIVGLQTELGEVLLKLGVTAEAGVTLRHAYALGGDTYRVDTLLLPLLEQADEHAAALPLAEWLAGHEDDPTLRSGWHVRAGKLSERLNDSERARDHFRKALELTPEADEAVLGCGRAHFTLGETDRALRLFDAVSRRQGAGSLVRADALVGIGRCRAKRSQLGQARACFDEALTLVPGHRGAITALTEL